MCWHVRVQLNASNGKDCIIHNKQAFFDLKNISMRGLIQALLLTSVFQKRLSFMTIGHNPVYVSMLALAVGGSYGAL